jgi:hypothetical protein
MIKTKNPRNREKIQSLVIKMQMIIKNKKIMTIENRKNLKIVTENVRENYHLNLSHLILPVQNLEIHKLYAK